jgi:hypothetical protein
MQPQCHKDKLLCFGELELISVEKSADISSVHRIQLYELDKTFLLVIKSIDNIISISSYSQ